MSTPFDAVILAGGLGTRMRDVFTGPKWLAPLGDGWPILEHVAESAMQARAWRLVFALGHRANEVEAVVRGFRFAHFPAVAVSRLRFCRDPADPQGELAALQEAQRYLTCDFALVLNGDTLPPPPETLRWAVEALAVRQGSAGVLALDDFGETFSGAAAVRRSAIEALPCWPPPCTHPLVLRVRGDHPFVDAGTPAGYEHARRITRVDVVQQPRGIVR